MIGVGSPAGNPLVRDLPLIAAFAVVAGYTYMAGLRAAALISFVKDALIYLTVIVAILYIPVRLGSWGHAFSVSAAHLKTVNPAAGKPYGSLVVLPAGEWAYGTLALGSALALFRYPHAATGVFAARRRDVIADSAIVIGALVPAAVMSIAAANLFTHTVYKELVRPDATPAQETRVAQLASLLMKVGALGFAIELNRTFSINLQLLGGIWILPTFPAIVISLYTRWFHRRALLAGWAAGMAYGSITAYRTPGGGASSAAGSAS